MANNNNVDQGNNNALIAVLVVLVIGIIAWIAYNQGVFQRGDNVRIEVPITSGGN